MIIIILIIIIISAEISWWSGHKLCNAVAEVCLVSSVVLLSCFQPVHYSSLVPVVSACLFCLNMYICTCATDHDLESG